MNSKVKAYIEIILSMVIFGSIGVFVKYINLPSSFVSMSRGIIAFIFMLIIFLVTKNKFDNKALKRYLLPIIISGIAIGFNWVLLFQSYKYTSVAVSTLFYYFAPVLIIIFSPLFFKEKITMQKIICIIVILVGMVFVSGIIGGKTSGSNPFLGIILAFSAAVLYASVIIINKKMTEIRPLERTMFQMLFAGLVMVPYTFLTEKIKSFEFDFRSVLLLIIVCIVHTGIAYMLYFSSISNLPATSCGVLSYIDPAIAVICSMTILNEGVSVLCILGAVLIIGGAIISEINLKTLKK